MVHGCQFRKKPFPDDVLILYTLSPQGAFPAVHLHQGDLFFIGRGDREAYPRRKKDGE